MKLLDEDNREALFKSGNSIYTKIRDDNPTRYINGSKARMSWLLMAVSSRVPWKTASYQEASR